MPQQYLHSRFEDPIQVRIRRELIIGTDELLPHDCLPLDGFRNVYFAAQTAQRLRFFDIGTAQAALYLYGHAPGEISHLSSMSRPVQK